MMSKRLFRFLMRISHFIVMDFIVNYSNPTHFNAIRPVFDGILQSLYARIALLTLNALYF
jgi:hypothetical protein